MDEVDLSAADATNDGNVRYGLGQQRLTHRTWLMLFALAFCGVMSLSFIAFVCVVLFVKLVSPTSLDWHVLLLGSALIVPPTCILFAILRRVFAEPDSKDCKCEDQKAASDKADIVPAQGLIKEAGTQATEILKAVSTIIGKTH